MEIRNRGINMKQFDKWEKLETWAVVFPPHGPPVRTSRHTLCPLSPFLDTMILQIRTFEKTFSYPVPEYERDYDVYFVRSYLSTRSPFIVSRERVGWVDQKKGWVDQPDCS